ncbi:MAG: pyruvate dehydrogenase (acetyl-transferring) E1 component subunit alpha [Gemmatimonadales bacterium]
MATKETSAHGNAPPQDTRSDRDAADRSDLLGLEDGELRELLRLMILARRFEEKTAESYQLGKIGGFLHLYVGQEAVAAGAITALREDDYVISAYREHAHALVRGVSARAVMAELYGRATGCSKGMGGSMHLFDRSVNFLGGHAIVGSHLPIAAGVGYAIRYRGGDQVCLCFFGDAAVNIGAFHEALNMAAKWELPVVWVIENNAYGMGTGIRRSAAITQLVDRACAYEGMASAQVDGMDVLQMRATIDEAVRIAREEKRPSLIEAITYRFMGHSMADPSHGTYRAREEVEEWREDDPILTLSDRLIEAGLMTAEEYEAMDRAVIEEVEESADFADASPRPDESHIYDLVYSDEYPHGLDRRDRWR